MSDYNSSLPVRTEAAGDVDIFISDATTPAQKLKVNADGSIDTNFATGSKVIITDGTDDLEVNADGSVNAVVSATDLDIRDLAFATDKVDASGSDVTATVSATDLDIRDLDHTQDNVAIQSGGNELAINADGSINVIVDSDVKGDEVVDFNSSASVAKDASVNHDYAVSALKTFIGEELFVSGSGKLKAELLFNGVLLWVGFNSTANPNIRIPLSRMPKASAGQTVRVTLTNRDNQAQDLYSTLTGVEV